MGRYLPYRNNIKPTLRDSEAHEERLAIVLESVGEFGFMDAERIAHPASLKTRYSTVATAALNDDWEPLWTWCLEMCHREGHKVAKDVLVEIYDAVAKEKERLEMLAMR